MFGEGDMEKYVKDEKKFHVFLAMMRKMHNVTLEQLCEGLCSVSMMHRIENGERLPEKQMRDRILSRMGVPLEGYEDYLSIEEYEQWISRQKIIRSIEKKNIDEAKQYLEKYRKYERQNSVEAQFCAVVEFMLLQIKNASVVRQRAVVERAVKFTMPNIKNSFFDRMLLSEQELNLLTECIRLCEYHDALKEADWKCSQYKRILTYVERSHLGRFCRAKVYPKTAYYLCETILGQSRTTENFELGIAVCNRAIDLLRDSKRLYYFTELVDSLEKLVNEYVLCLYKKHKSPEAKRLQEELEEKQSWRNVIVELYTEYGITPYIENFCYLYWETESYCIGDVIRTRRKMFGMTKEQLCEGICSVKTLTRIENKKVKTQMPIVRELFERLGLCAEYLRARIITNDYEILKLAEECVQYENNYKIKEWEKCLKELSQKLCMDIPQNKQFIMNSYYLLQFRKEELSKEDFKEKMIEYITE